jgi:hydrogenase 3 maturation protease
MSTPHKHDHEQSPGSCPLRTHPHAHDAGPGIDTVEHLVEHLREALSGRAAIVCVGNDLCGDDGAGPAVARGLPDDVPWDVFDTQSVPESFLMKIIARKPETVLLVDALDFGGTPGTVEIIQAEGVGGQGPSTHGPAPLAFLELLEMMHTCRRAVLGIQPQQTDFGDEMTPPVRSAVEMVLEAFRRLAD